MKPKRGNFSMTERGKNWMTVDSLQPGYWSKVIHGILSLARKYGPEVVDLACKRALFFRAYCYRVIKNILEKRLHRVEWEEPMVEKRVRVSKMLRPLADYESLLN